MPPKRSSNAVADDGDEVVFDLGKKKKVTVRQFKGMMLVDIREFYTKDGKELPGKKAESWETLVSLVPEINKCIENVAEGSSTKKLRKSEKKDEEKDEASEEE